MKISYLPVSAILISLIHRFKFHPLSHPKHTYMFRKYSKQQMLLELMKLLQK